MMNSPSNLMNYPDAYGQYYHPTPTPAAMAPEIHYRQNILMYPIASAAQLELRTVFS